MKSLKKGFIKIEGKKMLMVGLSVLLLLYSTVSCASNEITSPANTSTPTSAGIAAPTDLEQMLAYVPYSFLEEFDIWFSNPGALKRLNGLEELNSLEALAALPVEEGKAASGKLYTIEYPRWSFQHDMATVVGWDWLMIDRAIFNEMPPPRGFVVAEGSFDETGIRENLTGLGYQREPYGEFSYYRINQDMEIDLTSERGRMFHAQLNRVGLTAGRLVTAPATGILTGLLDAMAGDTPSLLDSPSSAAIGDSLGETLAAVLITPDRILTPNPGQSGSPFSIPAAEDWGVLHEYELAGIGYRDNGRERYWDVSLYYTDKADAEADVLELAARLESYVFMTQFMDRGHIEKYPLTVKWEVGEPVVREYDAGATLTISNRYLPETTGSSLFNPIVVLRDLLFLAPYPAPFLKR